VVVHAGIPAAHVTDNARLDLELIFVIITYRRQTSFSLIPSPAFEPCISRPFACVRIPSAAAMPSGMAGAGSDDIED